MRAILLAAGRGARLQQPSGDESPKCLLRFGGKTLLERHLDILAACDVEQVVVAVGFQRARIEAELASLGRHDVELVVNERYTLGSVLTLHTVADALTRGGDVLVMDADVLHDPRIVATLVAGDEVDRLVFDRGFEPGDEPVKVCLARGVPVEFRKRLAPGLVYDTIGESVGFFRLRHSTALRLATIVAQYVGAERAAEPHEEALRDLLLEGVAGLDVADVTGMPWIEIDFPADVARAADVVLPRIEAATAARTVDRTVP